MPTQFVRVKDPGTGHEVTVPRRFAEQNKLEPLDKPALDDNGRPLPGKPHVELEPADGAAGSGDPETDPATSTTDKTPTTKTGTAPDAATGPAGGSGQQAGKAATK